MIQITWKISQNKRQQWEFEYSSKIAVIQQQKKLKTALKHP